MKKTPCYIIITLFSFIIFLYVIPTPPWRDNTNGGEKGGGGGGGEGDDNLPFNFPHPLETMMDSLPYHYFEDEWMYEAQRGDEVQKEVSIHENTLLSQAKMTATQSLQHTLPMARLMSGRYRWLPDGLEHDLIYKGLESQVTKRVVVFQRLGQAEVVRLIEVDDTKYIHIIITLKGRLDKYTTFLHHITTEILPHDHHITLTIAYFTDDNIHKARNITASHLATFPNFKWSLLPLGDGQGDGAFSRGRGLHLAALQATREDSDLIFFCDVDVLMKLDFLTRCRANTLLGRQVYYPMVFSLYNPSLVYPLQEQSVPPIPQQLHVGGQLGFWREFGYGMSCVMRGDYESAGGFLDITVWGGEDEALFQQFVSKEHIKVIRAPDPALFHLHHGKQCAVTDGAAYVSCLKSRATTEGSKMQLGLALLKIQQGTDIEGVLSKKFYYFWLVPYLGGLLTLSLLTNMILALLLLMCARRTYGCKIL